VRAWLVGGAVIETGDGVLLVQNQRRSGLLDWSPPGGVIEQDYVFERIGAHQRPEQVKLSELFDGKPSLILYSFMYGPERDNPCPGCQRQCGRRLSREAVAFVQRLRTMDLFKPPGVAETIDWTRSLMVLDAMSLEPGIVADSLGALLKYQDDIAKFPRQRIEELLHEAP